MAVEGGRRVSERIKGRRKNTRARVGSDICREGEEKPKVRGKIRGG